MEIVSFLDIPTCVYLEIIRGLRSGEVMNRKGKAVPKYPSVKHNQNANNNHSESFNHVRVKNFFANEHAVPIHVILEGFVHLVSLLLHLYELVNWRDQTLVAKVILQLPKPQSFYEPKNHQTLVPQSEEVPKGKESDEV